MSKNYGGINLCERNLNLVADIIMPLVGILMGNIDFSNRFIALGNGTYKTIAEAKAAGVATLN
jgi:large conductance mechanosensitive channel